MKDSRHIIWTDYLDYDDWKEDLEAQYPELSANERMNLMYEINGTYFQDEKTNLDIQLSRPILVVGDLGLWHGRRMGYKEIESGNISDCLYTERDIDNATWFVDKNGDFRCEAIHHDGTNHYLYRAYKDGVSETQIDNLKEKIYRGTSRLGVLSNYIDYESFGRDIRFDESGVFADHGYVRSNGGRFVDIYDGKVENIPEEYRIKSPKLYERAVVGRTEKDMER